MAAETISEADWERITDLLFRLERGDTVKIGTLHSSFQTPSTLTVERTGKERHGKLDRTLYYRVYFEGPRGGNYVAHPTEKPDWKGKGDKPELFHLRPNDTYSWGAPEESSVGHIRYLAIEYGTSPDDSR